MQSSHTSHSPGQTQELAREYAGRLPVCAVVALYGEMGAGKTCFVQGMARAAGIQDVVNSPTFTLVNEYDGTPPLFHADLYRVDNEAEALDLGLDEYAGQDGWVVIEWPERVAAWLQRVPHWQVTFETCALPDQRIIHMRSPA